MIYFDNASTTKISDVVLGKMYEFMKTGFAMYMWILMGYTTGTCGGCSQMTA